MRQDLTVHSKRNPNKLLLQNVSGQVTGGFWAGKATRGRGWDIYIDLPNLTGMLILGHVL
jgi:hypothetical protein